VATRGQWTDRGLAVNTRNEDPAPNPEMVRKRTPEPSEARPSYGFTDRRSGRRCCNPRHEVTGGAVPPVPRQSTTQR